MGPLLHGEMDCMILVHALHQCRIWTWCVGTWCMNNAYVGQVHHVWAIQWHSRAQRATALEARPPSVA